MLAGLLALLVGRLVLRLQGIYLAIATIALVEIVRVAILNLPFTGGAVGIFAIPQPFASAAGYLLPALALLALAGWLCQRLDAMPSAAPWPPFATTNWPRAAWASTPPG